MSEQIPDSFVTLAKRAQAFSQTQWRAHGHLLKTPNGIRVLRALGITVCVLVLIYGCQFAVHHSERVRIEAAQQAEQQRQEAETERVRRQEAQAKEAAWQKYSRDNSNSPITYDVVNTSWIWLPVLGVVALVYALASRAYLFMAIGKTLFFALLLTSLALLVGDAVPDMAGWEFFQQFKATVTMLAAHLGVPVTPPLWLGIALVGGIVVESLSRLGSRSKIIVKPPNIVVQPAHVVVNLPTQTVSNVPRASDTLAAPFAGNGMPPALPRDQLPR